MDDVFIKYSQIGTILDYLSLGVIILSEERRVLSINRSAEMLTGRNAADVVGAFCYDVFLDYLCGGRCRFLESPEHNTETACSDIELTDQAIGPRSITRIESPIFDERHRLRGCMEVFQDHTAFKKLLQRVKYEDRRLKMILDNLDIGVLTLDRGSHITFFNTMAERITGFNRSMVLGKPCTTVFPINFCKDVLELKRSVGEAQKPTSMEAEVVTRDGQRLPIQAKCMALKNEEGRTVGGLTTITDLSLKYELDRVIQDRYTFYDMVGRDPAMQNVFDIVPIVAASEATVLIEGATGTGKDLLAKIIHNASPRSKHPLVKVNCAAIPDNLLESEMFGYVRGAFTGAERDKPGRFQLADRGTIFLDEIGDLPLSLQGKLLRVLEDREFYPLGSRSTTRVDVRILAATNQRLEDLVREKRFREDLYYRINVMRLELPPLRERRSDIPLLIGHILKRLSDARNVRIDKISEDALEVLLNYPYPGNVRELENILEHALIICRGPVIEKQHLPVALLRRDGAGKPEPMAPAPAGRPALPEKEAAERDRILTALRAHHWKKGMAAAELGINRTTLWRKMKKYGLEA